MFCKSQIFQMLKSRRARVTGAAIVLSLLALFAFNQSYDRQTLLPFWSLSSSRRYGWAGQDVDWSRFAYVQYVTNSAYLCNSLMLFEILHRLGSKADRLLMFPNTIDLDADSEDSKWILKARDSYSVKLMPIKVQSRASGDYTWAESYTKLLAFNQTQYDRVLSLDSDSTLLQPMDELFLLPPVAVAMPRAYWLPPNPHPVLSSQIVLIQPSTFEFDRVTRAINEAGPSDYDMEIVNNLYRMSSMIIPHRPYNLLTGEFRATEHANYLGSTDEVWDPAAVLREAKFLHFSDWPVPKPWLATQVDLEFGKAPCEEVPGIDGTQQDCRNQGAWLGFYEDFASRRQVSHHYTVLLNERVEMLIMNRWYAESKTVDVFMHKWCYGALGRRPRTASRVLDRYTYNFGQKIRGQSFLHS